MLRAPDVRRGLALALALALPGPLCRAQDPKAALDSLGEAYWQARLDRFPERATILGFSGPRNGRLEDLSPAGFAQWDERLRGFQRAAAGIDAGRLERADRVNLEMLTDEIGNALAVRTCRRELWSVDQLAGPQVALADLAELQPVAAPAERALLLARWRRVGAYLGQHMVNLRFGLDRGYGAAGINVQRVIGQLDRLAAQPVDSSPFYAPARRAGQAAPAFARTLRAVVRDSVLPAFRRYRDFLATTYAGRARPEAGIRWLPDGVACYRALIRRHTSLELSADEIHRIGLDDVAAVRGEMLEVVRRRFHTENLDSVLRALPADSTMMFATRAEVFAAARHAVARMEAKLPELIGRLPKQRLVVEEMPAYEERDAPAAYYYPGSADGSRPGRYLVNTSEPGQRPRYTAEVLAFHEGVPGHHIQLALSQELPLPSFRRYGSGSTALVEGWALYTERLADEAGMYSGDLDRLGMLIFQSWRACRLVIDTGIHALGWTREQAVDYLLANTGLSRLDAENEVDRYIADPGQALAYRLGQREITRLRDEARKALGPRFDLRRFHDVVLGDGAVTLPILDENVRGWIAAEQGSSAGR
ncbi:MAG: DUF885 domain-containing protein [Deltaproteobacteria bacterium]